MAIRTIRQHGGKSREYINTTNADIKKWQLMALHSWSLVIGSSAVAGDILLLADEDVAKTAKGWFAVIDSTMEFEADLTTETATAIVAGTKFAVANTWLTVATGNGFFVSTEDTNANATKVIGKFVDLPESA